MTGHDETPKTMGQKMPSESFLMQDIIPTLERLAKMS